MAFMMPVVKNDYDIYKGGRSRRSSECTPCRSRKVSECSKSEGPSLSTSPGADYSTSKSNGRSVPVSVSRQTSRSSRDSLQSPCKSSSSSPPKSGSSGSLNKFHTRLVDRLKRSLKCKDSGEFTGNRGGRHEFKPLFVLLRRLETWLRGRCCSERSPLLIA
uniref:Uncharacterized protein n=1 Tax=Lygus hesperus TaxID=30085 RepID=A0A0K8TAE4_LYGHE